MNWIYLLLIIVLLSFSTESKAIEAIKVEETPKIVSIWKVEIEFDETGKYKTKGSLFGIGDPVHETLTIKALVNSELAKEGALSNESNVVQFIRGVFWNDDPCAQLFKENDFDPLEPSWGVAWYEDFSKAGNIKSTSQEFQELNCPLLGRSHFGDFQFLHAMADRDGVKPTETLGRLLAWASVMYRVAIGEIDSTAKLDTDATAKYLLGQLSARSPMNLLRAKTSQETQKRALGSLLHMIQDSYAHGHIRRMRSSVDEEGTIVQFLSYVNQKSSKHAHDDSWRDGNTDLEKTLAIPGARRALIASTEIGKLYKSKAPWVNVEQYLKSGPLLISEKAEVSGPGDYK